MNSTARTIIIALLILILLGSIPSRGFFVGWELGGSLDVILLIILVVVAAEKL